MVQSHAGTAPAGGANSPSGLFRRPGSRRLAQWLGLIFLLAVAIGCLLFELGLQFASKRNTLDFLALYTSGVMLRQGAGKQLYDVALQTRVEHQLLPESIRLPFYHPPFEAWLLEPLAYLPLREAFLAWTAFNLLVLGLVFYLSRFTGYRIDQDRRLVWLVASLPAVAGALVKGQDSLPLALIFLLAFLALKKRRDGLAGLVLGAGLFRFEIMLPFLFVFFLRRRWKLLAGAAVVGAAEVGASLAIVGWGGLVRYAGIIAQAGRARGSEMGGVAAQMPSLRGALAALFGSAIPSGFLFPLVLVLTLLLLGWAAWQFRSVSQPRSSTFDLQFALVLIATLLASYHLFVYMLTPLLVAAFLILGHERATQAAGRKADRAGTILLLLVGLVPVVGTLMRFYQFSVVAVVLLGLCAWCGQENVATSLHAGQEP